MAKAKAEITLSSVVDVAALYRYYLLQSSTLAAPAKPTTNPPPTPWDDTEPAYQGDATNSLYTVDLTVFSDDTFAYSEVSLSSSYEAAKEAWNKANNAEDIANQTRDDTETAISNATATIAQQYNAAIDIRSDNILQQVSNEYSTKTEMTETRTYIDSQIQQTSDTITFRFNTAQEAIDVVDGKVDQNRLELEEYIRFQGASIELGKLTTDSGSTFIARLDNTELGFYQDNVKVAYLSNNKFMITDAVIKGTLAMMAKNETGYFTWIPEQNGSLSLAWRSA